MLCGLALMAQATVSDGHFLDLFSPFDDVGVAAEVDVGRRQIAEALMVAPVVVVTDEGFELLLEMAWQEVVLQQDTVLQGLVPALDLALCLGMKRRSAHMLDALVVEPGRQIAGN